MQKSLYSLILSDDVVEAVDRLAHTMRTNRSNMVNQILAEYVSYVTPEKRMQQIFSLLEETLSRFEAFQIPAQTSASVFLARSALAYKYNPSVQYTVELYRRPGSSIGELRVSMRTQNSALRLYVLQFFKLWLALEHSYRAGSDCTVEDAKFFKKLQFPHLSEDAKIEPTQWADAISDYVSAFDTAMKAFFYQIDRPAEATAKVEQIYRNYLQNSPLPF